MRATLLAATAAIGLVQPALAQSMDTPAPSSNFGLGEIIVTAPRAQGVAVGSATLSADAIYAFSRTSLDDAANLLPGVSAANSGGSRNERLIYVRGFNRFQVPLSIDGIRVYLPADNRLDFGRFLTSDIAEIQVAKGYVSVLDGPDGMGGAINLVTRKPTKALEADFRGTLGLGRSGEYGGYNVSGLIGTRHDTWYAQASYARNFLDHWDLAGGFTPTVTENGGHRDLSRTRDWRVNAKIGFTPNVTDEYALSYTRQEGSKLAPLSTVDALSAQRFWTWPAWNTDSLYVLSTTQLTDIATLKTRLFRNSFYNLLRSFDNRNENTQTIGKAFNSPYWDHAWGGSAELTLKPIATDTIAFAFHYRTDKHVEAQTSFPSGATEPRQTDLEDTFSLGAENKLAVTPQLTFTAGVGLDWRALHKAEEYGAPLGTNPATTASRVYSYPLANSQIWNGQGRLDWTGRDGTTLHASVSSRGRFPTIFERFSQRFGTSIPNPTLKPERATNYEVGGAHVFGPFRTEAALFYSHVTNAIVNYPTLAYACTGSTTPGPCAQGTYTQSRNLAHGNYYGGELSLEAKLGATLNLGANYTYTHRHLPDPSNAAFRPVDVPAHKAFVYADWAPITKLHVIPSLDIASDRWTVTDVAPIVYYRTGNYANAGIRIDYTLIRNVDFGVGARNLFDSNYKLVDGYPEQGRSFFVSLRAQY
ncbi:TonB-dependent receptor plug domain-containing protein [Sphingomonas sp. MMS24-J13]|uniref:TonB-dependent receptor plug domain-containing protein n=1 Tax=Sphingomonas sp. MMS24-J13 TaxID=3238686 RepID=UPI00384BFEF3